MISKNYFPKKSLIKVIAQLSLLSILFFTGNFANFPILHSQTFTKAATGIVVNDGGTSAGVSWIDYDNDGDLDLFITNAQQQVNFLYRNEGSGDFTKITTGSIVTDVNSSSGMSWGDYDNDGDLDLFIANQHNENNIFYLNEGTGNFTLITDGDFVNDDGECYHCNWGDYNNDGFLDLFVTNINGYNFLYQNNKYGNFIKISQAPMVNEKGTFVSSNWVDYDNDGDLDLFVGRYGSHNSLYRNEGNGNFSPLTEGDIVNDLSTSLASCWGDYDNDGDLDLYIGNTNEFGAPGNNFLYQNNSDGTFIKITEGPAVNDIGRATWSCSWADYDNDGDLDLYVSNYDQRNFLYSNNGDGTFTKVTTGILVSDNTLYSSGAAWGDYDNDGDLDLFVANWENQNNCFYINNGNDNNWINIKCFGGSSNFSAIGTKVRVKANINGRPVWQMREISTGSASRSQHSLNVEFGLGDATMVDSLKIEWPSGNRQVLIDVPVNQFLEIKETLLQHDLTITRSFPNPYSFVTTLTNITPTVIVKNIGINEEFNIPVTCIIKTPEIETYSDNQIVDTLKSFEAIEIKFKNWAILNNDEHTLSFFSQLLNDENMLNDTLNITTVTTSMIDNFESGFSKKWYTDSCWGATSLKSYSGEFSLNSNPSGYYQNNINSSATYRYNLNLSHLESAYLSFWTQYQIEQDIDLGYIEISMDNKQTWTRIGKAYSGVQNYWSEEILSLNDYCGTGFDDISIRFKFVTDFQQDSLMHGWFLDDIAVHPVYNQFDLQVIPPYKVSSKISVLANLTPETMVRNVGKDSIENVLVNCQIDTNGVVIYSDSQIINSIKSLDTKQVTFKRWSTKENKIFNISYYTSLHHDENKLNDTLRLKLDVTNLIDDFESALGNWHINAGWGINSLSAHSGSFSLSDSPTGTYKNNVDTWAAYNCSFDLSQAEAAHVSFWTRYFTQQNHDFGYVEFSIDSGITWQQIEDAFSGVQPDWKEEGISLTRLCGQGFNDVRLRFHFVSDSSVFMLGWYIDDVSVFPSEWSTEITRDNNEILPQIYVLYDNYPNPFNSHTIIRYQIPNATHIKIEIYNLLGQKIRTLIDKTQQPGSYNLTWDGKDELNRTLPSGLYLYKLECQSFSKCKKMIILR